MVKRLKKGYAEGYVLNLSILDNQKEFKFDGSILYRPNSFKLNSTYVEVLLMGTGKILNDFKSINIDFIYISDSEPEMKDENKSMIEDYVLDLLNSYESMQTLVNDKMEKEGNRSIKDSFHIANISLSKIDLVGDDNFSIGGGIYIEYFGNDNKIQYYDFILNGKIIKNSFLSVTDTVLEIEDIYQEICKHYINEHIEENGYICEELLRKQKEDDIFQ